MRNTGSRARPFTAAGDLPEPIVELVDGFRIVRDDHLPGGSKLRVLLPLLSALEQQEVVYGSPASGYAQIAVAHACAMLGKQAVIFVAESKQLHKRTAEALRIGARISLVKFGRLSVVNAHARGYAAVRGAYLVPWGVDMPAALKLFAAAARCIDPAPSEVWACAGSGTLIRGLQLAWPEASFHAVQVGARPDIGAAQLHVAPERYDQDAQLPPPYPSCSNYDAKVWRFVQAHAAPGALIWNVGA
jgi:hypothetical protein